MAKNTSSRGGRNAPSPKGAASNRAGSTGRKSGKKDSSGAKLADEAIARSSATGKLSASRIAGPTPGPRTISDEAIRKIVRTVMRKRSTPADA